jgi:membrane protease YdiL (CAAX protease family)
MSSPQQIASAEGEKPRPGSLAIFIALVFLMWLARVLLYDLIKEGLPSESLRRNSGQALHLLLMALPPILYLRFVDRRNPLEYLKLTTNIRRGIAWGILLSAAFIVIHVAYFIARRGTDFSAVDWEGGLNAFSFAVLAEEILFRGFILQKLREMTGFWKANILTSILFVAIHWPGWLLITHKPISEVLVLSTSIFGLSLLFGYALKKTESLLAAISVHIANNFVSISGLFS